MLWRNLKLNVYMERKGEHGLSKLSFGEASGWGPFTAVELDFDALDWHDGFAKRGCEV